MSKISQLKKSRNQWKEKAKVRTTKLQYLEREQKRIKKERNEYKRSLKETEKKLQETVNKKVPCMNKKVDIVYLALQLFLCARISFRAVSRVLGILGSYFGLSKTPCPQTLINWVTRLSIARMQDISTIIKCSISGDHFSNGFICILDTSIGLGSGKILTVLLLDAKHHELNENAPGLQHVYCVGVSVADSWTGESIAKVLEAIISVLGRPCAYLKDGGTDLAKAIRLLEERGLESVVIEDISHYVANLLKHAYQNHPLFALFLSSCGNVSKKLKQTILACLTPPKVSIKSRFMNLHRLVRWAEKILKHSPKGRSSSGSVLFKLRENLDNLPECKSFINYFLRDSNALLDCQKILKKEGLNKESYEKCQPFIEALPEQSVVRVGFTHWVEKQLYTASYLKLGKIGMPISSDSIESLFGVGKRHGTGEIKDANRIALRIPALCAPLTKKDSLRVLEISVQEQKEVEGSFSSLIKQRREILPNPNTLNELSNNTKNQYLELLPGVKNPSKNVININNSISYDDACSSTVKVHEQEKQHYKVGT